MRRRHPRPVSDALGGLAPTLSPPTLLASVQAVWDSVTGPALAAEAIPVSEKAGVVTVACRSAAWAQELELLAIGLVDRLNAAVASTAPGGTRVTGLRFVVGSQAVQR